VTATILGVRSGALGDVLLGIPSWQAIRRANPSASIVVAAPSGPAQFVASSVPGPLRIIRPDSQSIADLYLGGDGPAQNDGNYRSAEVQGIDWASVTHAVVWTQSGLAIADRLKARGVGCVVVAPPFPPAGIRTHVSEWLASTIEPLGDALPEGWDASAWIMPPGLGSPIDDQWSRTEAFAGGRFVVVHPGSGSARKCWPALSWHALIRDLVEQGYKVMVLEGEADGAAVEAITSAMSPQTVRVIRGRSLADVARLFANACGVIANDSGIAHLAAGLGVPTVAIFGPTDPAVWRPRGPNVRVCGGTPGASWPHHPAPSPDLHTLRSAHPAPSPDLHTLRLAYAAPSPDLHTVRSAQSSPSPELDALPNTGPVAPEDVIWPKVDEVIAAISDVFTLG